jgi:hypothetical protein
VVRVDAVQRWRRQRQKRSAHQGLLDGLNDCAAAGVDAKVLHGLYIAQCHAEGEAERGGARGARVKGRAGRAHTFLKFGT